MSLQPERLAEGWRLRGAAKREDLDWRGAEREECVCVCGCARPPHRRCVCDGQKRGRVDTTLHRWMRLGAHVHTKVGCSCLFSHLNLIKRFFFPFFFW